MSKTDGQMVHDNIRCEVLSHPWFRLERTIQRASEVADAVGEETQELARRLSQLKGALDGSQLTASRSPREQFPAASIANTDALAKDA